MGKNFPFIMTEENIFYHIAYDDVPESIIYNLDLVLGSENYTPLLWAAKINREEWIKKLMNESNIKTKDSNGNNIFHLFAENNFCIPELFSYDDAIALCYEENNEKLTPLSVACREGSIDSIRYYIGLVPSVVNNFDINGFTSGHIAVVNNYPDILKILFENGLDVEYKVNESSILDLCLDVCSDECLPVIIDAIFERDAGSILQPHAKELGVQKLAKRAIEEEKMNILKAILFMVPKEQQLNLMNQNPLIKVMLMYYFGNNDIVLLIYNSLFDISGTFVEPVSSIIVTELCRKSDQINLLKIYDKSRNVSFDIRDQNGNSGLMLTIPHTTDENHQMFDFMIEKNKHILYNKNIYGMTVFDVAKQKNCTYALEVLKSYSISK